MRRGYRLTIWIAFADFFIAIAAVSLALYGVQRHKNIAVKGKEVAKELHKELRCNWVEVDFDREQGSISLRDTLLFDFGQWTIKDPALLAKLAAALKKVASESRYWRSNLILLVRGHTDAWPPAKTSKFDSNLQLSHWRAQAVVEHLAVHGITAPQFAATAQGLGFSEPKLDNCKGFSAQPRAQCPEPARLRPPEELAPNRRIELRFGFFTGQTTPAGR